MVTMEKANRAVERLAENTKDSYQTVVDHAVGLQERNVRFAQGIVDGTIKELRHQAESNRSVLGELFEQSLDAYMDLAYAPFAYYKENLEAVRKAARG
jgi:hypothetical protein